MKQKALDFLPFIFAGLICGFILFGTFVNTPDYGDEDTIRIGIILPLTGGLAEYGSDVKVGIDIAVDEINAKGGGIGGKDVVAVYKNTWGGYPDRAAKLMREGGVDEGIPVFIGDITSAGALACAAVAKEEQIVLVSQAATTPELSGYSPYVFRTISSDLYQGRGMARIFRIFHPPDTDKITVLYINNTYGTGLMDSFVNAQDESGFTVQQVIPFEEGGQRTFTSEIAAIRTSGTDGVALISHVTEADYILKEAEAQRLNVAWVGSDGIVTTELYSHVGPYTEGFIATMQASEVRDPVFIREYQIRAKDSTVNWMAPYSYDTMMVVTEAIRHGGGYSADEIRDAFGKIRHLGAVAQKSLRMTVESPPPMT